MKVRDRKLFLSQFDESHFTNQFVSSFNFTFFVGGDEAKDKASPLHLCCQWGLVRVLQVKLKPSFEAVPAY